MTAKRTIVLLKERDQQALRALQARYHLATASDALRFALRTCDLSPAQCTDPGCAREPQEPRAAARLEEFAEKAVHDLLEPLSVVILAVELLGSPETLDAEARKFLSYALKGIQQLRAVISKLWTFSRVRGSDGGIAEG